MRVHSFSTACILNGIDSQTLPAALGVSSRLGLAMNSITVRRPPGEAAGAICKLISDEAPPLVISQSVSSTL